MRRMKHITYCAQLSLYICIATTNVCFAATITFKSTTIIFGTFFYRNLPSVIHRRIFTLFKYILLEDRGQI